MRFGTDFLLVQIYVDDIIFGGSSHALFSKFSEQMSREFEMSMMGELQFFLGHVRPSSQVHQGLAAEVRHERLVSSADSD
jgi:hypothetical protein